MLVGYDRLMILRKIRDGISKVEVDTNLLVGWLKWS
jgi:hypothetical protein